MSVYTRVLDDEIDAVGDTLRSAAGRNAQMIKPKDE
jgi:hypothetical protein